MAKVIWFRVLLLNGKDKASGKYIFTPDSDMAILGDRNISGDFRFDEEREVLVRHSDTQLVPVHGFRKRNQWYCMEKQYKMNIGL